jgi:uncharacterized protein
MTEKEIVASTIAFVKETLAQAEGGHDWQHINRVYLNAKHIAMTESRIDMFVVELGALLHDIADAKFHHGDEDVGHKTARTFLESLNVAPEVVLHVENIIRHISFKGSLSGQTWTSAELKIVQDADRLDAIGAIGIARAFNYGGHKNRVLYDPEMLPNLTMTKEEYKNSTGTTFNHFYEKLILLKDMMNTESGRKIAAERHQYMLGFMDQFLAEVRGEK